MGSRADRPRDPDRGSRFREARVRRGWTQRQLADKSGLTIVTISRVENGEGVKWDTVEAIAVAYGCPVAELMEEGMGGPVEPEPDYEGWREFKRSQAYKDAPDWAIAQLAKPRWPLGEEPEAGLYHQLLSITLYGPRKKG